MDSQKDFIHIDEVFKPMKDGEEREHSGAWLQMKDLLDKELPQGAVASSGNALHRYLVPLMALLLIGGAASYYYLKGDAPTDNIRKNALTENTIPALKKEESHTDDRTTASPTTTQAGENYPIASNKALKGVRNGASQRKEPAAKATPGQMMPAKGVQPPGRPLAHQTKAKAAAESIPETQQTEVLHQQHIIENITRPGHGAPVALAPLTTAGPAYIAGNGNRFASGLTFKTLPVQLNHKKIVQSEDGVFYKEDRDTIKQVDVVTRYIYSKNNRTGQPPQLISDTIAINRIEKIRYTPLNKLELIALKKLYVSNNVNAALLARERLNTGTAATTEMALVPLSRFKVNSKKINSPNVNKFIQHSAGGLANYFDGSHRFYLGILAGGNLSIGNPGAWGMQMGIAALYALNERFTVSGEFKVTNHYYNNFALKDQSITYSILERQLPDGQWIYTGTEFVRTSSYNINHFNSIEIPLLLQYNLGRVSIFGGPQLTYGFPFKWSKAMDYKENNIEHRQDNMANPYSDAPFRFNENTDFAARTGIGYVAGMSYDFSRKLSLDLRMTQVWRDNAVSNNEAVNSLFRMPAVQLSMGYYMGRRDKVVYILDRR